MNELLDSGDPSLYEVITNAPGPRGKLPLSADMLRNRPSGDAFGMTHNAGMGWRPETLDGPQYLMLSNLGGIRAEDGSPIALGFHTGHFELGVAMTAAADEMKRSGAGRATGCDQHDLFSSRQSGPGRIDHQEHGH